MLRLIYILLFILLSSTAYAENLAQINSETLKFNLTGSNNDFKLEISTKQNSSDAELTANIFPVKNPSRLVIDIPSFAAGAQKSIELKNKYLSSIRLGAHQNKSRLVIDIKNNATPEYDIVADEETGQLIASFKLPKIEESLDAEKEEIIIKPEIIKETVKETYKEVPKNTPTPKAVITKSAEKFEDSGTISIKPTIKPTPETFVMRGNEQLDAAPFENNKLNQKVSGALISNILFQAPSDAPLGAIVIEGEKLSDYQLEQKGKNLYELSLKNSKLAGDHLSLPQFPPATFKGFEVILANQEGSDVLLKVYVNEGVKIKSYNAKGKLWLKAEK